MQTGRPRSSSRSQNAPIIVIASPHPTILTANIEPENPIEMSAEMMTPPASPMQASVMASMAGQMSGSVPVRQTSSGSLVMTANIKVTQSGTTLLQDAPASMPTHRRRSSACSRGYGMQGQPQQGYGMQGQPQQGYGMQGQPQQGYGMQGQFPEAATRDAVRNCLRYPCSVLWSDVATIAVHVYWPIYHDTERFVPEYRYSPVAYCVFSVQNRAFHKSRPNYHGAFLKSGMCCWTLFLCSILLIVLGVVSFLGVKLYLNRQEELRDGALQPTTRKPPNEDPSQPTMRPAMLLCTVGPTLEDPDHLKGVEAFCEYIIYTELIMVGDALQPTFKDLSYTAFTQLVKQNENLKGGVSISLAEGAEKNATLRRMVGLDAAFKDYVSARVLAFGTFDYDPTTLDIDYVRTFLQPVAEYAVNTSRAEEDKFRVMFSSTMGVMVYSSKKGRALTKLREPCENYYMANMELACADGLKKAFEETDMSQYAITADGQYLFAYDDMQSITAKASYGIFHDINTCR
ncbi:hypothetical protein V5799_006878 [Amblyomma americanum]|uniref:Uncharacterized protein n=1 Tax=Amblyomma americanum TaxID=6943 RepID=A0AAQ4DV47_AMBAM